MEDLKTSRQEMDDWTAPQWVDFDSSVMSNIDDYFDIEHSELEPRASNDTQYESFPGTPNSNSNASGSSYNSPKSSGISSPHIVTVPAVTSCLTKTSKILAKSMNSLHIQSERKSKGRMSMTPRAFVLKKAAARSTRSLTASIVSENNEIIRKNSMIKSSKPENIEITAVSKIPEVSVPVEEVNENSQLANNVDDDNEENEDEENPENNHTLVEMIENNKSPTIPADSIISRVIAKTPDSSKEIEQIPIETEIIDKIEMEAIAVVPLATKEIPKISRPNTEVKKDEKVVNDAKAKLTKLQNRLDPSKRLIIDGKNTNIRPKPTVLTSQARRQSTSRYRRASNKYVPLAEAVSRFQNGTPERFRSRNQKDVKGVAGPLQKVKQTARKLTNATSPLLLCKYRTRTVSAPNQDTKEKLEMEEIRKNRSKLNPIKPTVTNPPKQLKRTTAQESNLTIQKTTMNPPSQRNIVRKSTNSEPPQLRRTMMNPPKPMKNNDQPATTSAAMRRTMMGPPKPLMKIDKKPTKIPDPHASGLKTPMNQPGSVRKFDKKPNYLDETLSTVDKERLKSTSSLPESNKHTPCKKTVPTVVSTDEGMAIKDVEILHFGIPVGNDYKKITRTVPFSFDVRNKELKNKRERLKSQQLEEEKKKKTFHARPVPSYVGKPTLIPKSSTKPLTPLRTCSFHERNELAMKKKKELFDQMVEREKQARVFHAKPAPHFKPVFVRGASAENLRTIGTENNAKITPTTRKSCLSQNSIAADQENTAPNSISILREFPKLKDPLVPQNLKLKQKIK